MRSENDVIILGFWVEPGKWDRLHLDTLAQTAPFSHGVVILKIEKASDLSQCHAVFIKKKSVSGPFEHKLIQKTIIQLPHLVQLDPIDRTCVLFNRKCTFDMLYEVELELLAAAGVKIMPSFCISSVAQLQGELARRDIGFPLICKPNLLTGVDRDHDMLVVFKPEHLLVLEQQGQLDGLLLQPMVKHQTVLKVSALGDEVHVATRPSIDKVVTKGQGQSEGQGEGQMDDLRPVHFYTPQVAKMREELSGEQLQRLRETIDAQSLSRLVAVIRSKFRLSLFSMDLIIDQSGKAFIIDLNSFPGYSGIISSRGLKHFHASLLNLALDQIDQNKS